MRQVRYHVASSLDGFIATADGGYDWITEDPDIDFTAMFEEYDTFLMGRKTYELVLSQFQAAPSLANMYQGKKIVVFSRTLRPEDHPDVTIVRDRIQQTIAELKQEAGKDIWLFGGGELFRSLLELECVDTVELAVIPVLLGGGLPFLPPTDRLQTLAFKGEQLYPKSGIVMLKYDVVK